MSTPPASRSSGSSTCCTRCPPSSSRLVVIHFGKDRQGSPDGDGRPEVREIYLGIERSDRRCSRPTGLTAFYGDFQALFGIDVALAEGETIAIIGANGAGKIDLPARGRRPAPDAPDAVRLEGTPIGGLPRRRDRPARHRHGARRPAPVPLAHGRGEPADRRLWPRPRAHGRSTRSTGCSRSSRSAAPARAPRCPAASSRWWRSAGR